MTPKEKAEEIFTHYHNLIQDLGGELGQEILVSILARQCALYAVELALNNIHKYDSLEAMDDYYLLEDVKEELIEM